MNWLERTPWWLIAVLAIAMALTPLGNSHFVEKWRMLFSGTLQRPLDWFDLVFHTSPLLLLLAKVVIALRR